MALVAALGVANLAQAVSSPQVAVKLAEIDPAIARLGTEALIDRLQEEGQLKIPEPGSPDPANNYRTVTPAFSWGFPPVAMPAFLPGNMLPPARSPVIAELVKRGLAALPALLDHLTDARPTRIVMHRPGAGSLGLADHYDARYPDPSRQPKGVNTVAMHGAGLPSESYALTVGDLCLRAVDHIVNRHQQPAGYGMGNVSVICSPTRYPALAAAVRSDWTGLSPAEHEQSLRADALEIDARGRPGYHAAGALARLLFYYPAAGREVVATVLSRDLIADDTKPPPAPGQVSWDTPWNLLEHELTPFRWEGMDEVVYGVFQKAIQVPGGAREHLLALVCARLLAGHGRDDELRKYFSARLAENEKTLAQPGPMNGPRQYLVEINRDYRAFLKTL